MNKTQLTDLIKEEIKNVLKESTSKKRKKPLKEAIQSLSHYYKAHGPGEGEYSFRQAVEEIDEILMQFKNAQLKSELINAITDAIDMAYDLGMEEAEEQNNFKK